MIPVKSDYTPFTEPLRKQRVLIAVSTKGLLASFFPDLPLACPNRSFLKKDG
jgi:hypothetical protein